MGVGWNRGHRRCLSRRSVEGCGPAAAAAPSGPGAPRRARFGVPSSRNRSMSPRAVPGICVEAGGRIGHGGQQQPRVLVQRPVQNIVGRTLLDDPSCHHHEHLVRDVAGAREVVGDVEERDLACSLQLGDQVQDPESDRDVEHRDRLVGEHDPAARPRALVRSRRAGAGLPRARAGYFAAMTSGGTSPTASSSSSVRSRTSALGHDVVDPERARDVVLDPLDGIERRKRVLEDHLHVRAVAPQPTATPNPADVLVAEPDRARGRLVEPREQARDRALAASARTDERRHVPRTQREAHVVDGAERLAPRRPAAADGEVRARANGPRARWDRSSALICAFSAK